MTETTPTKVRRLRSVTRLAAPEARDTLPPGLLHADCYFFILTFVLPALSPSSSGSVVR
jgi:hypothetical protein